MYLSFLTFKVENYEDNNSVKLQEESGESGDSDDTNSLHADASDHEYIYFSDNHF